jgi:hypothetical protein
LHNVVFLGCRGGPSRRILNTLVDADDPGLSFRERRQFVLPYFVGRGALIGLGPRMGRGGLIGPGGVTARGTLIGAGSLIGCGALEGASDVTGFVLLKKAT